MKKNNFDKFIEKITYELFEYESYRKIYRMIKANKFSNVQKKR